MHELYVWVKDLFFPAFLLIMAFGLLSAVGGVFGRFIVAFVTVSVLLSLAVCLVAYIQIYGITRQTVQSRAEAMALGLAELSAQHFAAGGPLKADKRERRQDRPKFHQDRENALEHPDWAAKIGDYALDPSVAYVYIEDNKGKIVAHLPSDLPRYLNRDSPRAAELAIRGVELQYQGKPVYAISKGIGGGGGFVHLGIWQAARDDEARLVIMPMVGTISLLVLGTAGAFLLFIRSINRRFSQAVEHAARLSRGELEIALKSKRSDEIGEIALSLERLRSSLNAAVVRQGFQLSDARSKSRFTTSMIAKTSISLAQSLRVIGQDLDKFQPDSLILEKIGDRYLARIQKPETPAKSSQREGIFRLLDKNRSRKVIEKVPKTIRFTTSEIHLADTQRRAQRLERSGDPTRNLSFDLRALGDYLDHNRANDFSIRWEKYWATVRYGHNDVYFNAENLHDLGIRMYMRRITREPTK